MISLETVTATIGYSGHMLGSVILSTTKLFLLRFQSEIGEAVIMDLHILIYAVLIT